VPRLVAAPDKLRGTATAQQVAEAVCEAAATAGWSASTRPMSDGGEGFLDVLGGERRTTTVTGPLGDPVAATWSLLHDGTALIESAQAAGRALVPLPLGDAPVVATTAGVGQLIATALRAGAASVVVGCGGVASTDGGEGCVEALASLGVRRAPLVAACDVDARFLDAPAGFGPQKGATPDQVAMLTARLDRLAADYQRRFGVDVTEVPGAGAAGGLAGGLLALGARLTEGARLVAESVGLDAALADVDLVVTAEGHVDRGTLEGKVVAEVLAHRPTLPALVVAGIIDWDAAGSLAERRPGPVEFVELDPQRQARDGTTGAIAHAVAVALGTAQPGGSRQAR
jgi:glycerate kinase